MLVNIVTLLEFFLLAVSVGLVIMAGLTLTRRRQASQSGLLVLVMCAEAFYCFGYAREIAQTTLAGAIYVTVVCLLPEFLQSRFNVPFYFGGTSLLIIVVVTMDFMSQVQAYIMSHQYESLLKKGGFGSGLVTR